MAPRFAALCLLAITLGAARAKKDPIVSIAGDKTQALAIEETSYIGFGVGLDKATEAGRIGYQTFSECLDIKGAGTEGLCVKIWDDLIAGTVTTESDATVGQNLYIGNREGRLPDAGSLSVSTATVPDTLYTECLDIKGVGADIDAGYPQCVRIFDHTYTQDIFVRNWEDENGGFPYINLFDTMRKGDLQGHQNLTDTREEFDKKLADLEAATDARFSELEASFDGKLAAMEARFNATIVEVTDDLTQRIEKLSKELDDYKALVAQSLDPIVNTVPSRR